MKIIFSIILILLTVSSSLHALPLSVREHEEDLIKLTGSGAILVPSGTTGERPTPVNGMFRYNTTTGLFEQYESGVWINPADKNNYSDADFTIFNDADPTKQIEFDGSSITTGTVRTYVLPDSSGVFALLGINQTFTGINTFSTDILMTGTGQFLMPVGTTAQRTGTPVIGYQRYNTTLGIPEVYDGIAWVPLGASTSIVGPGSSTDNAIVRYDGVTGKVAQDSGIIIDDTDNITGVVNLTASGIANVNDLDVTTNIDAATLVTTGTADIDDLNVTTNIDVATMTATGTVTVNDLNVTTNIDTATMITTGSVGVGVPVPTVALDVAGDIDLTGKVASASGNSTFYTIQTIGDILVGGIGQIDIPAGTTAERSATPNSGMIRLNTDLNLFEGHNTVGWIALGGPGVGDVVGPAGGTDNAIARYDSASGKMIQDSGVIIDDLDNVSGVTDLTAETIAVTSVLKTSTPCNPMTTVQRDASTKAAGSCVYNTDVEIYQVWTGLQWKNLGGGALLSAWLTGVSYPAGSFIYTTPDFKLFIANVLHVAGATFAGDAANWDEASDDLDRLASSTDEALVRFDGITGDLVQDSGILIDDTNNISGIANLTATGTTTLSIALTGPIRADAGVLSVANTDLTSEVTGILPIANGGTNSSTALVNDKILYSQTGQIVESGITLDATNNLSGINNLTATGTTTIAAGFTGPIRADAGVLSVSNIDLTSEVANVLPIANGGTNSSTALTNNNVMYSQGNKVVESGLVLNGTNDLSGIKNLTATGTTTLAVALTGVAKLTAGVVSVSDVDIATEVTGVLPIANGGTNSSTALVNSFVMESVAGAIVESLTTSTELSYLNTATSDIQVQIDSKEGTLTNSAGLAAALSDETGTGLAVFNTAPTVSALTATGTTTLDIGLTGFLKATAGVVSAQAIIDLTTDVGATILPIANGGTGSATQNFVDLTTAQTVAGVKTFSSDTLWSGTGEIDLPSGTTAQRSGSPNAGMFRFNSTLTNFEGYDGSSWNSLELTPITTQGDLVVGNATPVPARLAIGADREILTSDGTTASWDAVPFINSYSEANDVPLRQEHCRVDNSGTPATGNALCDTWIDSITDNAVGRSTINITPGTFPTATSVCTCTQVGSAVGSWCQIFANSTSAIQVYTQRYDNASIDYNFNITCTERE